MALRNLGTTVAPAGEKFFDSRVVPVTSVDWFIPHFLIPWSFHNALFPWGITPEMESFATKSRINRQKKSQTDCFFTFFEHGKRQWNRQQPHKCGFSVSPNIASEEMNRNREMSLPLLRATAGSFPLAHPIWTKHARRRPSWIQSGLHQLPRSH